MKKEVNHFEERSARHNYRDLQARIADMEVKREVNTVRVRETPERLHESRSIIEDMVYALIQDFGEIYGRETSESIKLLREIGLGNATELMEDYPAVDITPLENELENEEYHPTLVFHAYRSSLDNRTSIDTEIEALEQEIQSLMRSGVSMANPMIPAIPEGEIAELFDEETSRFGYMVDPDSNTVPRFVDRKTDEVHPVYKMAKDLPHKDRPEDAGHYHEHAATKALERTDGSGF